MKVTEHKFKFTDGDFDILRTPFGIHVWKNCNMIITVSIMVPNQSMEPKTPVSYEPMECILARASIHLLYNWKVRFYWAYIYFVSYRRIKYERCYMGYCYLYRQDHARFVRNILVCFKWCYHNILQRNRVVIKKAVHQILYYYFIAVIALRQNYIQICEVDGGS